MLEVEFYDGSSLKESINAENLAATLEKYPGEQTGNAYYFYLAKTSPDKDGYFSEQLDGLGEVELYVKRGDGYPKRVQQMRAPLMVVSPEPYRSLLDPYAAVLICKDDEGNEFLKKLEPPQHDKWDPALGDDIRTSRRIYKSLQDWVRNKLKSLSQAYEGETTEIPGLADYLASMERDDRLPFGHMDKSDEDPEDESGRERIVPVSSVTSAHRPLMYSYSATKADKGSEDGEGEGQGGHGRGRGHGGRPNPDGRARSPQRSPIRVRNVGMTPSGEFTDVDLCLYSKQPFEGTVRLIAAGEDVNAAIRVINAHSTNGAAYATKSGRIMNVKIDPVRPTRITVHMDGRNIRYALGVESHENNS
jgi:hypothetical protein